MSRLAHQRRVTWRSSLRYEGLAHQSVLRTESSQPAFKERLGGFTRARQRLADSSLLSKARRAEKRHRFLHMRWASAFLGGLPSTLQQLGYKVALEPVLSIPHHPPAQQSSQASIQVHDPTPSKPLTTKPSSFHSLPNQTHHVVRQQTFRPRGRLVHRRNCLPLPGRSPRRALPPQRLPTLRALQRRQSNRQPLPGQGQQQVKPGGAVD